MVIFFAVGSIVYFNLDNGDFVIRMLPFYFFLILQEFFIHFKLENSNPEKKVTETIKHPIETVEYKLRAQLERHPAISQAIQRLMSEREVKHLNNLLSLNIPKQTADVSEDELLRKTLEICLRVKGTFIRPVDLFASYLLLLDLKDKTLFNSGIDESDVLIALSWVRKSHNIDGKRNKGIKFTGSGVFDFFIYGWSAQIERYSVNFTRETLSTHTVKPIGRSNEYDLLITALSKNSSSNALLVGRAGVGKSTLISQFVLDSNEGKLPRNISSKIVFKLHAERLIAGIGNMGDLEERFISLFSELSHAGNIIVFIPNIENIFGGGGLNFDLSGALTDYLKSNNIKIIGTTTPDAFQQFVYHKQEIKELFDIIEVGEPDEQEAIYMILEKAQELEILNRVKITLGAVKEACRLSESYANDGTALPGRAIRLLDDVITNSATHGMGLITDKEIQRFMEEKTHIVLDNPSVEESKKLLNLESEIHKKIVSQDEAVSAISDAMRRVRSGMKEGNKPIASFLFLGPTGVGKTETAKALAGTYFGDEDSMIRLDMSEFQNSDSVERFLGRQNSTDSLADKVLKKPFALILLDEFEKAYPHILDLFLQILDEGRLTDNLGRTVSFSNTIIIATSNAGSEFIRESFNEGAAIQNVKNALVEKIQQDNIFKPELINRFDDVIVFQPLSQNEVVNVAKLFLNEVIETVSQKRITLSYDETVPVFIAENSYSIEFGARNIKRFIEQSIENQLSKLVLSGSLGEGRSARIAVADNRLIIKE